MAPAINFYAGGGGFPINNLAGSGLGFYGTGGFGSSVNVGQYQNRTFITDSTGALQGPEVNNVQYLNTGSGILGQAGSGIGLKSIPNWQATINPRFTYDFPCQVNNAQWIIFDRSNINNQASGVMTQCAQVIHPNPIQGPSGSGDTSWTPFDQALAQTFLPLANSPGMSGLSPSGSATKDVQHDWYILVSASPDSIGSKNLYGAYLSLYYF